MMSRYKEHKESWLKREQELFPSCELLWYRGTIGVMCQKISEGKISPGAGDTRPMLEEPKWRSYRFACGSGLSGRWMIYLDRGPGVHLRGIMGPFMNRKGRGGEDRSRSTLIDSDREERCRGNLHSPPPPPLTSSWRLARGVGAGLGAGFCAGQLAESSGHVTLPLTARWG